MRSILKWSIPIVLVGAAVWFVLSFRITMPISEMAELETPLGQLEFRLVVLPHGPVRINVPPLLSFEDTPLPQKAVSKIYTDRQKRDEMRIRFSDDGTMLNLHKSEGGLWHGTWTGRSHTGESVVLPVRTADPSVKESDGGSARAQDFVGSWRIRTNGSSLARLDLSALPAWHDGSEVMGYWTSSVGEELDLGGVFRDGVLQLSYFDGRRAMLLRSRLQDDGTLTGEWWDSQRGIVSWTALRE